MAARPERFPVEMECLKCGYVWRAEGRLDAGAWLPEDDSDLFCPNCGTDNGEGGGRDE